MVSDINGSLTKKLKTRIGESGPLTLAEYISACLMDPDFGYYQRAEIFGSQGDFITAPEISQVFGELLGLWAGTVWQIMGEPQRFNFIELGPGRGTLMADALRALKVLPLASEACQVHLVETSDKLRLLQKETLSAIHENIHWHRDISTVPDSPTIILANEFLDALPIRQFLMSGGQWHERLVGYDKKGAFHFTLSEDAVEPPITFPGLNKATEGDFFETRHIPKTLLPASQERGKVPFAALFIDYGHLQSSIGNSFQAVQSHAYSEPLLSPGMADLTAHVDFAAFADQMRARGHIVDGPISQNRFLGQLGIIERAGRLMANSTMSDRNKIESQVARLISPRGMGSRFKVIAVRSPDCPKLPGLNTAEQ